LVATIVAWIAYQQFRLAREKFKLDLFEKRFAVYSAARKLVSIIVQKAHIENKDLFDSLRDTHDSTFLFDQEIVDYLEVLYHKAVDLDTAQRKYGPLPVGDERTRLADIEHDLLIEFGNELRKLKDAFAPYLKFRVWK
jgi:hypothetical protein